jgi:exosortase A-associated hydrolase 1
VLIVVGGPQYRIGSHRQFVSLARFLAGNGIPSLRFDVRGMGDSDGRARNFEHIERDVAGALDTLHRSCGERAEIVVFGLCDAASAALLFAARDPRVCGLVLANPWVRNDASLASTHLKRYYGQRLLEPAFWRKVFTGEFGWRSSLASFVQTLRNAANLHKPRDRSEALPFQTRMATAWRAFGGRILLLLSGKDLTAQEFLEYSSSDPAWRGLLDLPNVTRAEFGDADHTFSSRGDQLKAERRILDWLDEELPQR